jgi:hypothetical protein
MTIDIDAARKKREAARREAKQKGPKIKFGGKTHELAPEVPFAVLEALRDMMTPETADVGLVKMSQGILGKHWEAFQATSPSVEDVQELIRGALEEYGISSPLP